MWCSCWNSVNDSPRWRFEQKTSGRGSQLSRLIERNLPYTTSTACKLIGTPSPNSQLTRSSPQTKMAEDAATTAQKRALEEEDNEQQLPAEKKQKTGADEPSAAAGAATGDGSAAAAAGAGDAEQPAEAAEAQGDGEAAAAAEGDGGGGDADMQDDGEADAAAAADGGDGDGKEAAAAGGPVQLGYRTFQDSKEAADYLHDVLKKAVPHRKLNEVCVFVGG